MTSCLLPFAPTPGAEEAGFAVEVSFFWVFDDARRKSATSLVLLRRAREGPQSRRAVGLGRESRPDSFGEGALSIGAF